jgi:hypothetical protein
MLGRAPPIECSSSRVMRCMTGIPAFFESSAGIITLIVPLALLPKPPPVYSLTKTISSSFIRIQRAIDATVWMVLCVPA